MVEDRGLEGVKQYHVIVTTRICASLYSNSLVNGINIIVSLVDTKNRHRTWRLVTNVTYDKTRATTETLCTIGSVDCDRSQSTMTSISIVSVSSRITSAWGPRRPYTLPDPINVTFLQTSIIIPIPRRHKRLLAVK
jgi:hypothetical protein